MDSQRQILKYSYYPQNASDDYLKLLKLQYNYIHSSGSNYLEQRKVLGNLNLSMQDPNIPLSYYLFK